MTTPASAQLTHLGRLAEAIRAARRAPEPVRLAREYGTCPRCEAGIQPGHVITKAPGRAWAHADCGGRRGKRMKRSSRDRLEELAREKAGARR